MEAADTQDLVFELGDRVATLTLNRPDRLNALSDAMIDSAVTALRRCAADPEVGAVLVTGAGRAFCAGGDVSAMGSGAAGGARRTFEDHVDRQHEMHELSWLLATIPKVTIAAVNGAAAGAGLGIALSCDLCFSSDRARFGTAFAKVGFGGDFGTTWQLTRRVGPAKAKELFFLAELLPADGAARAREPCLPERRVRRRGPRHRAAHRAWTARELPLHEGEREHRCDGRLSHAPRPRGNHTSALRPDGRPSRGSGRLSREARAALPGEVSGQQPPTGRGSSSELLRADDADYAPPAALERLTPGRPFSLQQDDVRRRHPHVATAERLHRVLPAGVVAEDQHGPHAGREARDLAPQLRRPARVERPGEADARLGEMLLHLLPRLLGPEAVRAHHLVRHPAELDESLPDAWRVATSALVERSLVVARRL